MTDLARIDISKVVHLVLLLNVTTVQHQTDCSLQAFKSMQFRGYRSSCVISILLHTSACIGVFYDLDYMQSTNCIHCQHRCQSQTTIICLDLVSLVRWAFPDVFGLEGTLFMRRLCSYSLDRSNQKFNCAVMFEKSLIFFMLDFLRHVRLKVMCN